MGFCALWIVRRLLEELSTPTYTKYNMSQNLNAIWRTVLEKLKVKLGENTYETWFSETKLVSLEKGLAKIGCKNSYVASGIDHRYHQLVKTCLDETTESKVEISFTVRPELANRKVKESPSAPLFAEDRNINLDRSLVAKKAGLNPRYTFDRFIVGSANRLAHAAAMAVAENPGTAYNPLFVYGGVGLGKTHLLQAIGNFALWNNPSLKVLYSPAEPFVSELIEGIRSQSMLKFREKYRQLDMLILDDIQFISGKDSSQEEFFNTFNTLYQSGKQIIVASDRPPSDISKLEDRIKSRLEGGLVADMQQPDFEMRMAILTKKSEEYQYAFPEAVLITIAEEIRSNIRELEGMLMSVAASVQANNAPVTVKLVRDILKKTKGALRANVKPDQIIDAVAEQFGVRKEDITGRGRTAEVANARQVAMYLIKEMLNIPLTKVASAVRRGDHTTVIHACRKIENALKSDQQLRQKLDDIRLSLQSHASQEEAERDKA